MLRRTLALIYFIGLPAFAQGPQNVLLVVNQESKVSRAVGEYYQRRRGVPVEQVCSIHAAKEEEIDRAVFDHDIRQPILDCLTRRNFQDRILYIVLTKGIPLKVKSESHKNDQASVDSELTLLYLDLLRVPWSPEGRFPNPYYRRNAGGNFLRFSHREFPMYLVTRLDGYDLGDVFALVDRALSPSSNGRFVLDLQENDHSMGDNWLREAAQRLGAAGVPESRIRLETSSEFLTNEKKVLGYASWGSNDSSNHSRFLKNTWVNGALLVEFVSTDARTFQKPPDRWTIGKWSDPPVTFFEGSPQSLIGDYIHEGVTGAAGHVYEPYLDACVQPQVLFPAYVRGLNLAESFYAAMPYLSWQTVVVGDPLAAIVRGEPLPAEEADPPLDPASGLPKFFAQRLSKQRDRAR